MTRLKAEVSTTQHTVIVLWSVLRLQDPGWRGLALATSKRRRVRLVTATFVVAHLGNRTIKSIARFDYPDVNLPWPQDTHLCFSSLSLAA